MKISSSLIIQFIRLFDKKKIIEIAIEIGFLKRKKGVLADTSIRVYEIVRIKNLYPTLKTTVY